MTRAAGAAGEARTGPRRSPRLRLAASTSLRVVYRDDTAFGGMVSGRCELEIRKRLAVLHAFRAKHGLPKLLQEGAAVLDRVLPRAFAGLSDGPHRLRDEWLYPDPRRIVPAQLAVERGLGEVAARVVLPAGLASELAAWLGEWERGARAPRAPAAARLWEALREAGALVTRGAPAVRAAAPSVTFVGHATLLVDDGDRRVLVDPFLLPRSRRFPRDWQPACAASLGRIDAVLLTHSHPDHYDPGTLLRLGRDTPIHVPDVARESVLAIDMVARLRELGFREVHPHAPGQVVCVGGVRAHALPFHGEQPTTGERLHPEVRNEGLTWLVEAAGRRLAVLADAGVDGDGDVKRDALATRAAHGAADGVFCGYRGFALLPVQYAFSSVSRYLPFVPRRSRGRRQQIMCDAGDLLDVAAGWGASWAVPYAAGGAPWYWLRGLGPRPDGPRDAPAAADPLPSRVVDEAARRGGEAPAVRVLRVGETLAL